MRGLTAFLLASLLIGILPAAAWEGQDGRFAEVFSGSGGRFATEGEHPSGGAELFATAIPGDVENEVLLDRSGHVITFASSGPGTARPVAIDAVTGTIDWEGTGAAATVRPECVGVAPDGTIWAQSGDDAELLAIDPADGSITGTLPLPTDSSCGAGLQFLPDNQMVLAERCCSDRFHLIDLVSGAARTMPDGDVRSELLLTSTDGRRVYVMASGTPLQLLSVDLVTGVEVDRITLPGAGLGSAPMTRAFVLPDDGIIIATDQAVLRIDDDGSGRLVEAWQFTPDATSGPLPSSLVPVGPDRELIAGWQAAGAAETLLALDAADGSVVWRTDARPGASGGVRSSSVLSDAAGNVILPQTIDRSTETGDFLYDVIDADGIPIGQSPPDITTGVDGMVLGPDGTLYLRSTRDDGQILLAVTPGMSGPFTPGVSRIDAEGGSVTDIAISACRALHPADGAAPRVLLARVDVFADALAGAPLAGEEACILYTAGGPDASLDPATAAEIERVLAPGGLVQILGGVNAISAAAESTLDSAGIQNERFAGGSRFETATLIADAVRDRNPAVEEVILAFAGNWPDAVTGGALGGAGDIPILLTETEALNGVTAAWLASDNTQRTIVVGGTSVISDAAADATPRPRRVSGDNRMATAVAIAEQEWRTAVGYDGTRFMVVNLERADAWTVALAGAPLAARERAPQLGVGTETYPAETEGFLTGQGFTDIPSIVLVGDASLISDGVAERVDDDISG